MASPASFTATPLWKTILIVITICATQVFADSWYALCYFPNGDISPHDTPCSDDGGACCPKDWECLSNGMCIRQNVFHERHSCTDQRWLDARCPRMCITGDSAHRSEDIKICDNDGSWCCNGDPEGALGDCCAASAFFSTELGTVMHQVSVNPSSDAISSAEALFSSTRDATVTTIPAESSIQTSTSITSNSDGQASTVVSIVVVTAAPSATTAPSLAASSASKDNTPAIIGGTLAGVAVGIVAAGFIGYALYRRHKKPPLDKNTGVSFPPDSPIHKPGFKHVADAELDTHPNTLVELPTSGDPGELDATPTASPIPNNRVSAVTTGNDARWSAVSSLSPPSVHIPVPAATVAPTAASLQTVSQQHYRTGQQSYLLAPEYNTRRLHRPLPGTLPAIQIPGSEIPPTPGPGSVVADGEQSGALETGDRATQSAQRGEEAQEAHRGEEQAPPAHNQGEAPSGFRHTDNVVPAGEHPTEAAEKHESYDTTNGNDEDKHASMAPRVGGKQQQASKKQ